jgi:hypothetical protein
MAPRITGFMSWNDLKRWRVTASPSTRPTSYWMCYDDRIELNPNTEPSAHEVQYALQTRARHSRGKASQKDVVLVIRA